MFETLDASINPEGSMELLSRAEVANLKDTSRGGLYQLFRQCSLAVLNSGQDDALKMYNAYPDFDIKVLQRDRGIKLILRNAPASAFVDGQIIKGLQEHLFSVVRDIIFINNKLSELQLNLGESEGITNAVFEILRNAGLLVPGLEPNLVVCWGGHAISRDEYDFTKEVGYELGLRGLDIVTGCGPGAMKGSMKGATIAHAKQRISRGRYIGVSEPGIIAAEPPNAIVNHLVVMPDIEKRLEAFVRLGHGIVIFPGGVGTLEEVLYILGVLAHPGNRNLPFPVFLVGAAVSREYLSALDRFLVTALGDGISNLYEIIIDDPQLVASKMAVKMQEIRRFRRRHRDAYYYNWRLTIPQVFQFPFDPTHQNMASLNLHPKQEVYQLAANLRCAFSGLVAGNVKKTTMDAVSRQGPFNLQGDADLVANIDKLLRYFVSQQRMSLDGGGYIPCYTLSAAANS